MISSQRVGLPGFALLSSKLVVLFITNEADNDVNKKIVIQMTMVTKTTTIVPTDNGNGNSIDNVIDYNNSIIIPRLIINNNNK